MAHRENKDQREYLVTKVLRALLGCLEKEVYQVQQDIREEGEIQEDMDLKDHLVNKANEGCKELEDQSDLQVNLAIRVIPDLLEPQEKLVLQE
jgi:HEPN domain-containing protein